MTSPETTDRYAPTKWGAYDQELVVPSGQMCRVRKLDFPDVMAAGLMDKLNTLQGVVDKNIRKGEGQPPADPLKMLKDRRTSLQMAELLNQIVVLCVTAPTVVMPPEPGEERVDGVIYADSVGMMDKMEIFQFAMGDLTSLESFREGAGQSA
jgi:hypothetical protein